jgi:hypothetical protein
MELIELQTIWKRLDTAYLKQSTEQVLKESLWAQQKHISKMKRNLVLELIMIAILYGAVTVFYFFAFDGRFVALSVFTLIVAVFYSVYLYRKYKLLSHLELAERNVHSYIKSKIRTLESFTRVYLISGTLLVTVSLLFLFFLFYFNNPAPSSSVFYISESGFATAFFVWLIITAIITTGMYFVNAWYIRRLYGKHIEALKNLLSEFDI